MRDESLVGTSIFEVMKVRCVLVSPQRRRVKIDGGRPANDEDRDELQAFKLQCRGQFLRRQEAMGKIFSAHMQLHVLSKTAKYSKL